MILPKPWLFLLFRCSAHHRLFLAEISVYGQVLKDLDASIQIPTLLGEEEEAGSPPKQGGLDNDIVDAESGAKGMQEAPDEVRALRGLACTLVPNPKPWEQLRELRLGCVLCPVP